MTKVNPTLVLAAIVVSFIITAVVGLTMVLSGHSENLSALYLFAGSVIGPLFALKGQLSLNALKQNTEKVEEVHRATNSMKDELVKKTETEALMRGAAEERARAELRDERKQ